MSESETKSRVDKLAQRLLDDRTRHRPVARVGGCFLCGKSYSPQPPTGDDSTRFCSAKCREAYDAGAMPAVELNAFAVPPEGWRVIAGPSPGYMPKQAMRMGRHGFFIDCLHCRKEFESKGLRCCSTECERAYTGRAKTVATLAEIGEVLAEKRACAICGGPMSRYVGTGKHRRLANKTKTTCSNRCRAKARKMGLSEGSNCVSEGSGLSEPPEPFPTVKPPPIFGPSTMPANVVGGYRFLGAPDIGLTGNKTAKAAEIVADEAFPNMWRVRLPGGGLSDLLNRTRAEDVVRRLAEERGSADETTLAPRPAFDQAAE
jgi:hypothetical protein